ncbi:MAG: hypothetical protein SPL51_01820 [Lachnospiraceae bacterium]|nr:hypothetical protein [Lachnospiraceae bacterium]
MVIYRENSKALQGSQKRYLWGRYYRHLPVIAYEFSKMGKGDGQHEIRDYRKKH